MNDIYSMTGFASGAIQHGNSEISCEIRSLNSRYLEMNIRLPLVIKDLEEAIKGIIREKVSRGKVSCSVTFSSQESLLQNLKVNQGAILMYKNLIDQIRNIAGINEPIKISDILEFKDVFALEEESSIDEALQNSLFRLITDSLVKLNQMRIFEGENLREDLDQRLSNIHKHNLEIKSLSKGNSKAELKKLYNRLLSLVDEKKVDRNRLEMELALISDRVDISEEVVRMESHLNLFRENLAQGSPIGKKLNFILQEMHREASTMSTKNTLIEVSHRIVAIKEEIERVREQVQNIE
jgi:uncharacterized protein (TIGR00255 family)